MDREVCRPASRSDAITNKLKHTDVITNKLIPAMQRIQACNADCFMTFPLGSESDMLPTVLATSRRQGNCMDDTLSVK